MTAMDDAGEARAKEHTAPHPEDPSKPDSPTELQRPTWKYSLRQAFAEFQRDRCTDLAAGLTYHSVLAIFPGILAVVSVLGLFGDAKSTTDAVIRWLQRAGQADVADQLKGPIEQMTRSPGAGIAFAVGLLGALWSASAYIAAFGRAMNKIYEVDEGRPAWKLRPVNLAVTVLAIVMAVAILLGLIVSGPVAAQVGRAIGLSDQTVTLWNVIKWPVMIVLVIVLIAVLYRVTPNVRQPRFRWLSLGAVVAIIVWAIASVGFTIYVSTFGSYNKTYGSLAGVIIFLLWLWITNVALLFGAEVDAEVERGRELQAGIPAERTLQLPPKDSRVSRKNAAKLEAKVDSGRRLREILARRRGEVPREDPASDRSRSTPGVRRAARAGAGEHDRDGKKPNKLAAALAFAALVILGRRKPKPD